jgi:metal-responsive CopG/Arc/MetJ family transcriptional regulator
MKAQKTKIISVSMPADLLKKADKKAKAQYQNRSQYINSLIFLDTRLVTSANAKTKGN